MVIRRAAVILASCALVSVASFATASDRSSPWVASWAAASYAPEADNRLSPEQLHDLAMRQVFHLSVGGREVRLRVTNAAGTAPLTIDAVHVARAVSPGFSGTVAGTDRLVTFSGQATTTIPAGADRWSDPIPLAVPALSDLSVTFHTPDQPGGQTCHPGAHATSWIAHGPQTGADFPEGSPIEHWCQIAAVEVQGDATATVVAFGDSITDGHASTTNGNDRWPDVLARRLQGSAAGRSIGVVNEGIGGNHLLTDGLGPRALTRLDGDALSQSGARWMIVLEGINDLGKIARDGPQTEPARAALVSALEQAYSQIVARAHQHGIRVFGGTITPDTGSDYYHPAAMDEAARQALNRWIRTRGHFDAVIDFDAVVRDPADQKRLLPAYDSGDHLHPSPAGYAAMGNAIPLDLFR